MKTTLIAGLIAASFAIAGAATAADAPPATAAAAPAAKASLSMETTPIADLAAKPETKAVLDKHFPGMTTHPAFEEFKAMSVKQVQPMAQGAISDDAIAAAQADLDKLPK
jgi:hypothetical protein